MLLGGAWCRLLGISLLSCWWKFQRHFWQSMPQGKTVWAVPILPDASRISMWAGAVSSKQRPWSCPIEPIPWIEVSFSQFRSLCCPDPMRYSNIATIISCLLASSLSTKKIFDIVCNYTTKPEFISENMSNLSWWWSLGFGDVEKSEGLDFVEIFSGHIFLASYSASPDSSDIIPVTPNAASERCRNARCWSSIFRPPLSPCGRILFQLVWRDGMCQECLTELVSIIQDAKH